MKSRRLTPLSLLSPCTLPIDRRCKGVEREGGWITKVDYDRSVRETVLKAMQRCKPDSTAYLGQG
ncbi:hypothetical protein X777_12194 [Ooceraea biroi]|uniref:Uncharacterized protein n=1 Tax=Ooceraea biroi TaxID=2015173 RepID=A0A026W3M8_OOCBI|nr:hypothetical protein X777_12194 [Ooceraea biroi]